MSNYYKREDLDSALSELLVSPYANEDTQFSCGVKDALKLLRDIVNENVPDCLKITAADVRENVRGEWHDISISRMGNSSAVCSICGATVYDNFTKHMPPSFCPNCGADMRKEEKK